jgi:CheY-like chemotaxis protein
MHSKLGSECFTSSAVRHRHKKPDTGVLPLCLQTVTHLRAFQAELRRGSVVKWHVVNGLRSILAVDDNAAFRRSLVRLFREHIVHEAATGREALLIAKARPFHLYILDYSLPDMTGIELCRIIRSFDPHTPVLVLSAHAVGQQACEAGADSFLLKGDADRLVERVTMLLGQR